MASTSSPVPSTACTPSTWARIDPCFTTCSPPAFVATIPPIVAVSRADRSTPNESPSDRTWAWRAASVAPAPTVTCAAVASTAPIESRPRRSTTTSPVSGTDPPTSPVFPPCGTERDLVAARGADEGDDVLDSTGPKDRRAAPLPASGPVDDMGSNDVRIGDHPIGAERLLGLRQEPIQAHVGRR